MTGDTDAALEIARLQAQTAKDLATALGDGLGLARRMRLLERVVVALAVLGLAEGVVLGYLLLKL
jgi:hypothetical protein